MNRSAIIFWFIVVLIIKTLSVLWLVKETGCLSDYEGKVGVLAYRTGDTRTYTGAMENYIQKGTYFFVNRGGEKIFSGRLPHYSIPYYLFRQLFSKSVSSDLMIFLQIFIEVYAIVLLGLMTLRITKHKVFFFVTLFVICLSLNWTHFSYFLSPESLSISFFCFSVYWFYQYQVSNSTKSLLLLGIFLGILGSLKPYLLPLYVIPGFHFLKKNGVTSINGWKRTFKQTIIISVPLLVLLTPWTLRNYQIHNKLVPLQINLTAGYHLPDSYLAMRNYVKSWGGQYRWWYPYKAGCFFDPQQENSVDCDFILPKYLETTNYNHKDIIEIRNLYIESKKGDLELQHLVAEKFIKLTEEFYDEHPVQAYLYAPLRHIFHFIGHSGSYFIPLFESNHHCYNLLHLPIKVLQTLVHWGTFGLGVLGLVLLQLRTKKGNLMLFIILYLVIFFALILREVEWRMFHTTFPVLVVGSVYLISELYGRVLTLKKT